MFMSESQAKSAEPEALQTLATAPEHLAEDLPQKFHRVDEYTTFFCEYTFKDGDIHFHFFQTEDQVVPRTYWNLIFPQMLDRVAMAHFEAVFPQLQASFIEGVI